MRRENQGQIDPNRLQDDEASLATFLGRGWLTVLEPLLGRSLMRWIAYLLAASLVALVAIGAVWIEFSGS